MSGLTVPSLAARFRLGICRSGKGKAGSPCLSLLLLGSLSLGVLSLGSLSLGGCAKSAEPVSQKMRAFPAKVAKVDSSEVSESSTYVATLRSRKSVIVRPKVAGYVTNILVHSGQVVQANTHLIEVDSEKQQEVLKEQLATEESNLEEKKSAQEKLHSLKADRRAKVANLEFAKSQYDRYKGLQAQGAVAQESVEQYFNQFKAADADLSSIDAQILAQQSVINKCDKMLKQSASQANQERVQLTYHTVSAPFPGIVGDIPVKVGQYVEPSTALTTIDQSRPLEVYVYIPADQSVNLKVGLNVELLDANGKQLGTCPITFVSPEVSDENQSVLVKALFENSEERLRAYQQVTARVIWNRKPHMLVPTQSVVHISGQDFVFVAKESAGGFVAKQIPVTLGDIMENSYVVKGGMKGSEKIVVSDVQNLFDGAPIAPSEVAAR